MKEDINNKTVDKAWVSMKALLDQEMPTKGQRRRFIWWWFALLLLPLAVVGAWYLSTGMAGKNQPIEQETNQPAMPFAADLGAGQLRGASHQQHATESENLSNKKSPTSFYANQVGHPSSKPEITESLIGGRTGKIELTSPGGMPAETDIVQQGNLNLGQSVATSAGETKGIGQGSFKMTTFASLPLPNRSAQQQRPPSVAIPLAIAPLPDNGLITPAENQRGLALGISTNIGTERLKALNIIAGGMAVHWQPSRRWGIRSGLYYARYSPSSKTQPTTTLNYSQYNEILNADFEIQDLAGNTVNPVTTYFGQTDAIVIPVSKLEMLEMPLLLSYQLPDGWKLFAGMAGSYVVDSKARGTSYAANSLRLKANTDMAIESLNNFVTASIDRWRFDLQGGLGLKLGRYWEFGLFAKLPIQRLTGASEPVPVGANSFLDLSAVNLRNRLPMTFALQANCYLVHK